jgi:UMF1 family MFS transporter
MRATSRSIFAWCIYDWANSAFITVVVAAFFPIFFADYWNAGNTAFNSTSLLGPANSLASILVAAAAPLLGAIADQGGTKKRFLLVFTSLGVVMTGSLFFVAQGNWLAALLLYVFAIIGFSGGLVFYDSLIISVATAESSDRVSAIGYSFGYLAGALLFGFNVWMVQHPESFGLTGPAQAVRVSFLLVAVWWAVFSLPLMFFVKEPSSGKLPIRLALHAGVRQLGATLRHLRDLRPVWMFLLAYWFYIDGVDTVVRMAADYGKGLGFSNNVLMTGLLITQVVGFPAALVYSWLGPRVGTRRALLGGIVAYIGVVSWGSAVMETATGFYGMAVMIGLIQGGIQALSRSLYSRLIPRDKAAQFFGFYNMLGKFAAFIGPLLMAVIKSASGSARLSMFSITILFVIGGVLLTRVDATAEPVPSSAVPS